MVLNLTVRHMTLNDEMRSFVEEKVSKIEKHLHHDVPIHIVILCEKHSFTAEIQLHDKGVDFHSRADESNMESAVEVAIDKLDKQICRHKEKDKANRHMPGHEKKADDLMSDSEQMS